MRSLFDDFDEFDYADSMIVNRIIREQRREERRLASRRALGPGDDSDYDDFDDSDDDYDFDEYDYDSDDSDRYADTDN